MKWLAVAAVLAGCASSVEDRSDVDPNAPEDETADELRKGTRDQWIYDGPLPHLDNPSIVVSQTAHTAKVTGYLPASYDVSQLPFYVDAVLENGRTRIAVVYPIATGESFNAQPSTYQTETIVPWVPTNDHATWGGFPFMSYKGGVAFHGPITAQDGEWRLIRGPVSHGCNRMQGEHVVELANLIGIDMTTKVYGDTVIKNVHVPVTVIRTADTWRGHNVDVDYPATRLVQRPRTNVQMFKTWDSRDFPAVVCALKKSLLTDPKVVPAGHCAYAGTNKYDLRTGPR